MKSLGNPSLNLERTGGTSLPQSDRNRIFTYTEMPAVIYCRIAARYEYSCLIVLINNNYQFCDIYFTVYFFIMDTISLLIFYLKYYYPIIGYLYFY
ncbi:hypothetical protein JM93_00053 [Roseibium hamelinense]|uniref:Uncharacterized protein n=1 Tax=Roseibium hamelinense TaxID=150831 RepID=A0A562TG35_9HYPH|nr:hypothetical protein JM93_00053 [Roseibium hamelinense]